MLDLKTLKANDTVRVVDNVDNNVGLLECVNIGDVGIVKSIACNINKVQVVSEYWRDCIWYFPHQLENVTPSEDLIIYKSRWDEIIEGVNDACNMTEEEENIVKSVLKNNTPFNVVPDLKVVDPVLEKEDQTVLDANYVGVGRNGCFYYRSDILKQWFYWNEDYEWGECDFDYNDVNEMLPVSFGINLGESK